MSKKALSLLENPPSASSSEDDEISSGEESDQEQQPMEPEPESSPKHRSGKATAATPSKKRKSEGTSSTQVTPKRAKTTGQKSAGTSRAWSEEADEISLLQHLIAFHGETGTNPIQDKLGFFNFVKNNISFEVNKSQVDDKIRHMKKKYIVDRNYRLGQAHDDACFRLVKDIWADDGTPLLTSKNNHVLAHTRTDKEVFTANGEGSGKKVLVQEDEGLVCVGEGSGVKVVQGAKEDLAHDGSRKMAVEQGEGVGHGGGGDKVVQGEGQDLAHGSGNPDWFEKSVFVKSLMMFGVAEKTVKERWSLFSPETKKRLEQKWKSLESKKLEVVSLELEITSDLASEYAKAT